MVTPWTPVEPTSPLILQAWHRLSLY